MKVIEEIIKNLNLNYHGELDSISFLIDVVLVIGIFLVVTFGIYKKTKKKNIFTISSMFFILFLITIILDLQLMKFALIISILVSTLSMLFTYHIDTKHSLRNHPQAPKTQTNYLSDQNDKKALIDTLVTTCEYFSSRKIGAIITIEQENSLNVYSDKAVKLDALVSIQLLKTIFFPNTALHDGAVIIRGNRIICAATYYTLSVKTDVIAGLGTRHQAAIGISEETDAFTIVVSEQTGQISTTYGGAITKGLTEEALRISLDQHIKVR